FRDRYFLQSHSEIGGLSISAGFFCGDDLPDFEAATLSDFRRKYLVCSRTSRLFQRKYLSHFTWDKGGRMVLVQLYEDFRRPYFQIDSCRRQSHETQSKKQECNYAEKCNFNLLSSLSTTNRQERFQFGQALKFINVFRRRLNPFVKLIRYSGQSFIQFLRCA